jgi:hypothetical protein
MTNYKLVEEVVKQKVFESITCDVCKKKFDDLEVDMFEMQEVVHIQRTCGYGSVFGDENEIELDICQHCLKEKLGQYVRILDWKDKGESPAN